MSLETKTLSDELDIETLKTLGHGYTWRSYMSSIQDEKERKIVDDIEELIRNKRVMHDHSVSPTIDYTMPEITQEEYDKLHDYIIKEYTYKYKITDTKSLRLALEAMYVYNDKEFDKTHQYLISFLSHIGCFYKEDMNDWIETTLDFILDKPQLLSKLAKYRMGIQVGGLFQLLFVFTKRNIKFGFNKLLHLCKKLYDNKYDNNKYTLYKVLQIVIENNIGMMSEVMRVFPLLDILTVVELTKKYEIADETIYRINKLDLKMPIKIDYGLDDIAAIYNLNKDNITPEQLSLITGLNIRKVMKDGYIFFERFNTVLLDMLDESIPLNVDEYSLTDEEYRDIYSYEYKEFMRSFNYIYSKDNLRPYIQYYIIEMTEYIKISDVKDNDSDDKYKFTKSYKKYVEYHNNVYKNIHEMFESVKRNNSNELELIRSIRWM